MTKQAHTRPPAVAGTFYQGDPERLAGEIAAMLAESHPGPHPAPIRPKALIVPHVGHIYSGPIAARAYALLVPLHAAICRVVLLGPVPLQGVLDDFTLVPFVVGDASAQEVAEVIEPFPLPALRLSAAQGPGHRRPYPAAGSAGRIRAGLRRRSSRVSSHTCTKRRAQPTLRSWASWS